MFYIYLDIHHILYIYINILIYMQIQIFSNMKWALFSTIKKKSGFEPGSSDWKVVTLTARPWHGFMCVLIWCMVNGYK